MLNRYILLRCGCFSVSLLALASCSSPDRVAPNAASPENPVIATYAGGEVRRSDIADSLATRIARQGAQSDSESRRATVLALAARQARIGVLHQQALAAQLDKRPDVAVRIQARKDLALAQAWIDREVLARSAVSDQIVDAELARRLPKAARAETRAFSHIFLRAASSEEKVNARRTAAEIRTRLNAGEAFSALAVKYSDSISARSGGSVKLTSRSALSEDLGKLIFELPEGAVSEPIENHDGLHIFRVDSVVAGATPDTATIRAAIASELQREAQGTAESKARQLAVDESGINITTTAKSLSTNCSEAGNGVSAVATAAPTCEGFSVLRKRWPEVQAVSPEAALAWLVANRMLAQHMLDQPGASADGEIARLVAQAARNELVAARRDELLDAIHISVSEEDLSARRTELGMETPELHEFVVDLLLLAQSDKKPDDVNRRGEQIAAALRKGDDFSQVLDAAAKQPDTRVLRDQGGLILAELSIDQPPLRDELLRLAPGEVSAVLQLSGNPIRSNGKVLIDDHGLLFVRKREERVLGLEAAREFLIRSVTDAKRAAAQDAIKANLDRQTALKLLLVDG
ncbi:MAG: peptidylprolyl isomerase [Tahibacter sp.]